MARYADADVILVADIDRGGVFASAYGSIALQLPEDRKRIKGIIVNKFRGDLRLFESGVKLMEETCGVPLLGVIPYYKDIYIEEEDSLELQQKQRSAVSGKVNISVVLLRHLSNFTDFNRLERDERVNLYYTNNTEEISKADIVIMPGTKSTLDDLLELRRNGVAEAVVRAARNGATVIGICGGYQMMGLSVEDPEGVEGGINRLPGLGLLPVSTVMQSDKVTRQTEFRFLNPDGGICKGYEIHMGQSDITGDSDAVPLNYLQDGTTEGWRVGDKCFGTYMHGILDNEAVVDLLLAPYVKVGKGNISDYRTFKEEQYDRLAAHVRSHLNMPLLYEILGGND